MAKARGTKQAAGGRRRGVDKDAMAKSLLVLLGLVLLAAACMGQHGGGAATASAASWDDGDDSASTSASGDPLQQRQAAMREAVKVFSGYGGAVNDPRALKRAVSTVNDEVATMKPIFKAVSRMPEGRAKEEARAAAMEQLTRHLSQLIPGGTVRITDGL